MRVDVAPTADDDVLDPAGQIDVTGGDIGQIARVQPLTVAQTCSRGRIVQIALGRRGSAKLQASLATLRQLLPGGIYDTQLVAGQRLTAGDELQRIGFISGDRLRLEGGRS